MHIKTDCLLLLFLFFLTQPGFAEAQTSASSSPADFSGKIYGGIEAKPEDWPWMSALLDADEPDIYEAQYCSGVLIDDTWILTAAHCVNGKTTPEMNVAVGVFDLKNFTGPRIPVKNIYMHPRYSPVSKQNDIALLELSQASSAPALALFSGISAENTDISLLNTMVTALGWGLADGTVNWYYPERLRQVNLPVVADSNCNNIYSNPLISSQLCAGYYEGKDVCNGDSGGPLVTKIDDTWVHAGLVSYGKQCYYYFGWYGVYTRTSEYIDFIEEYVPDVTVYPQMDIFQKKTLPFLGILLLHDSNQ